MKISGCYYENGLFWFRVLGYGVHIKNTTKYPLLFSERNNHVKYWKVGNWVIKLLTPKH